MAVERSEAERLRAWLLAAPIALRARETGFARSTLHDWLSGVHRPRGGVLRTAMGHVEAWERELVAARAVPTRKKALPPEPPKRWAQ